MTRPQRSEITIPVQPWFRDHSVGGKTLLPGVETLLLLAGHALEHDPGLDIRVMEQARFARFLEIPPHEDRVPALVEWELIGEKGVRLRLLSRVRFKKTTRLLVHGEVEFPGRHPGRAIPDIPRQPAGSVTSITAKEIYGLYVPFGPAFQSLQNRLLVTPEGAWGTLTAPGFPLRSEVQAAGSPFPLDGALHAACVHGQQLVDYIPFPVGFSRRDIIRGIMPGETCATSVVYTGEQGGELLYDLALFDQQGRMCEYVGWVRMRDVGVKR